MTEQTRKPEGKSIFAAHLQQWIPPAITALLGLVVKRAPDADAYARAEPALIESLLEARRRMVAADLGEGIATPYWQAA